MQYIDKCNKSSSCISGKFVNFLTNPYSVRRSNAIIVCTTFCIPDLLCRTRDGKHELLKTLSRNKYSVQLQWLLSRKFVFQLFFFESREKNDRLFHNRIFFNIYKSIHCKSIYTKKKHWSPQETFFTKQYLKFSEHDVVKYTIRMDNHLKWMDIKMCPSTVWIKKFPLFWTLLTHQKAYRMDKTYITTKKQMIESFCIFIEDLRKSRL